MLIFHSARLHTSRVCPYNRLPQPNATPLLAPNKESVNRNKQHTAANYNFGSTRVILSTIKAVLGEIFVVFYIGPPRPHGKVPSRKKKGGPKRKIINSRLAVPNLCFKLKKNENLFENAASLQGVWAFWHANCLNRCGRGAWNICRPAKGSQVNFL